MKRFALAPLILCTVLCLTGCSKETAPSKVASKVEQPQDEDAENSLPEFDEATIKQFCTEPAQRLPQLRSTAKQMGIPLSMSEFVASQPIPTALNAQSEYEKANKLRHAIPPEQLRVWHDANLELPVAESRAVLSSMNEHRHFFDQAEKASKKPSLRFEKDWRRLDAGFADYAELKNTLQLFLARAYAKCRVGDGVGAVGDVATCYRIARHVAQLPGTIAVLNAQNLYSITNKATQYLATVGADDLAVLKALRALAEELMEPPSLAILLQADIAHQFIYFNPDLSSLIDLPEGLPPTSPIKTTASDTLMCRAGESRFLEMLIQSWQEFSPTDRPIDFVDAYSRIAGERVSRDDPSYALLADGVDFTMAKDVVQKMGVRKAILQSYLDVLIYRQVHGKLPVSLKEAKAARLDTFSGKPLIYKTDETAAIIYSVGPDKVDNGGIPGKSDDIVFSYPAVLTKR